MADLFSEIKWRGLAQSNTCSGDLYHLLNGKGTTFYVGTDPTGKSLHVGHLLAFIVARILQSHGHKPIVLVGGATALLGDPSFKAEERKLISVEEMESNAANIKKQLSHLIDFNSSDKSTNKKWSNVGVSTDVIEASWIALVDSIEIKLSNN